MRTETEERARSVHTEALCNVIVPFITTTDH